MILSTTLFLLLTSKYSPIFFVCWPGTSTAQGWAVMRYKAKVWVTKGKNNHGNKAVPWSLITEASVRTQASTCGLMVDKVARDRCFFGFFGFPTSIIPLWLPILISHLKDKQYTRWWLQFRDGVSNHRHEHEQQPGNITVILSCIVCIVHMDYADLKSHVSIARGQSTSKINCKYWLSEYMS